MLTAMHKQLLNDYQQDFPLSPTPYQDIASSLGVTEEDVLLAFNELADEHFISRIGSIIVPNHIGVSTLVAMAVPVEQLQSIADIVSRYPEVNHNYERENRFNLWFVMIAKDDEYLQSVIETIETESGFNAMQLPLLADYFINLGFEMDFDD
ncbi:MAG TPA: Lrp/AsnC family transcriptional regulator [Methyloprofundus sp.]|uniref:Lrp/AsnC family transcriptional regulator n=1 Tax=Methyloprofundus sp. TaxID=2020875 RepID=UPI0017E065A8|nr:Lrp/AsnC family transcriptional regulator [Methyloprofundus sp.]HIG64387.1 Lrp/AsnC family transcriptional regulator [Methyloprofundus sp.]HIL79044.1 Lrp/AsnC family transcriptional regulator [Methylococcales bacterium]